MSFLSKSFAISTTYPKIVTNGLVLNLDAGQQNSYRGYFLSTSGTTWADLSGNANNGTLTNMEVPAGGDYSTDNGGSLSFDGVNEYAPIGTSQFPFGASPGTLSCWVKTNTISGGFSWIVSYGSANAGQSRFLGINGSTYYFGGYSSDITVSGVPLNSWFNMVGVYNGTSASMYINGVLVSGPTALSWNTVASSAQIGRQTNGGEYWNGNISQVSIYNRALSDTEIRQNYDALKGRFVGWNYTNNATLTQGKTTDVVSFAIATNVSTFSSSGTLPTGTSLSLAGSTLTLSGTLAQFGYAANSIGEGGSYTLSAADFGVTRTFTITANGETRTLNHRQIGNLLISKTFESYGTPNNVNFVSLGAQQGNATTNPSFTTSGCAAVGQLLSGGGVASVTMNANNTVYGDPCGGVSKRLNVSYTI